MIAAILCTALAAVAGAEPTTFAQRLASSQAVKRALDIAAVRAAPGSKVFYVRTTGSDSNNGLGPSTAFRTVQKAVNSVANPGSFIVVGPGTYAESLSFTSTTRSGTSGNPNTLFADTTAALTGGSAGPVVISGGTSGLTMASCNYWTFKWLKFSGQSQGNVYIMGGSATTPVASWLTFDGCEFVVTPYYGLLAYYVGSITVNDCTFTRSAQSGLAAYVCTTGATQLRLTANRLNRTGSGYDSTAFKRGVLDLSSFMGGTGYSSICYGVIGMAYGATPTTVTIQNNIVTDAYMGVYAYGSGGAHTLRVTNNTALSCYYGYYTAGMNGTSGVLSNNMAGNCYVGSYTSLASGAIAGHMEWGINLPKVEPALAGVYATSYRQVSSVTGFVTDQTPAFVSASTGDFSLDAGSAGLETGNALYAPTLDAAGITRPLDGDNNGVALVDFGAVESPFIPRLRIIRWRSVSADE